MSPIERFVLQKWSEETSSHVDTLLKSVWLLCDEDISAGKRDFSHRFKQFSGRVRKLREDGDPEAIEKAHRQLARLHILKWSYGSESLIGLVWVEILTSIQYGLYWIECGICGRHFMSADPRKVACPVCKGNPHYAARYQRLRMAGLPDASKKKLDDKDAALGKLRRGTMTPEEFLLQYPDHRPHRKGKMYERFYEAAQRLVESGKMRDSDFKKMFPHE